MTPIEFGMILLLFVLLLNVVPLFSGDEFTAMKSFLSLVVDRDATVRSSSSSSSKARVNNVGPLQRIYNRFSICLNLDYHFFFVFQTLPRHSILHPSLLKIVINKCFLERIQLLSKLSKIVASFSLIDFKQHGFCFYIKLPILGRSASFWIQEHQRKALKRRPNRIRISELIQ